LHKLDARALKAIMRPVLTLAATVAVECSSQVAHLKPAGQVQGYHDVSHEALLSF
jgi:hypothetical protein